MEEKNSKDNVEKDHNLFVRICLFRLFNWLPKLLNLPTRWLDLLSEIFRMSMGNQERATRRTLMTKIMRINRVLRKESKVKENTRKHAHDCQLIPSAKDPKHRLHHSWSTIMTIRNNLQLVSDKQTGLNLRNWPHRFGENFRNRKGQNTGEFQRRKKKDTRKRWSYLRQKIMTKSNRH